jgi:phosphatidylserine decarboxylase
MVTAVMISRIPHQFIDRITTEAQTENLFCDAIVNYCYSEVRERANTLFKLLCSARTSQLLGYLNFDFPINVSVNSPRKTAQTLRVNLAECVDPVHALSSPRTLFERKIRYWDCRPMPKDTSVVVSPADAKVLIGSFARTSRLFLKNKFFCYEELLGSDKYHWLKTFHRGEFAVFRLTPDKYHYNHTPVAGRIVDIYEIPGRYHSCNPGAVIMEATPYSKNKRVITIIDTEVDGGTHVGLVAMIEVVALMIGDIKQCYSETRYDVPKPIVTGMHVQKGCPKSLYRPGSSVDILVFQRDRIIFSEDIVNNMYRNDVQSRFSKGFGRPLAETNVEVRSEIARKAM